MTNVTALPRSREIRVFLSSTFKDMEAERNHLLKYVFPKVRAACQARQVGFTEIDLRWGVTEEESKNGATVEICLKEIDRCRDYPPFFIGFLGERYGWIPKHDDLTAYWQKHRNSAYAEPIRQAVARGISVTELEMELAVLSPGAADRIAGHALFLLRDIALTNTLYTEQTGQTVNPVDSAYYDTADGRLSDLKTRLRHSGFLGIDGYTRIEQFGQAIETYLLAELDRAYPEGDIPTPLEKQNQAHAAFRYHRLQNFLPREDVRSTLLNSIAQRIDQPNLGPILLGGPSGQGKSALMADLAQHLEGQGANNETNNPTIYRVFDHYFGADAASSSLDAWVERVLHWLHPEIADLVGEVPQKPKDQKEALSTWTAYVARRREQQQTEKNGQNGSNGITTRVRLVFLLDALDQRSESGVGLEILQVAALGPDAIVVTSVADGTKAAEQAKDFVRIEVPPLDAYQRRQIIDQTLARYKKGLAPELITQLAKAPQSQSPLFLMLALEELRLDARFETLHQVLDDILQAQDSAELFLNAFLLDPDYSRPEQPDLAARFMAMIGAAWAGLTEQELSDLLALPTDPVAEDTGQPRLPQQYLSKLMAAFHPFLLNKGGNRAPMHRIFDEVALRYCAETTIREVIYTHFCPGYGRNEDEFNSRGATEALYQITQLGRVDANRRDRLFADLAHLKTPAGLHEQAEAIVFDALASFSHDEKTTLGGEWAGQVEALAVGDSEGWGELIGYFAGWVSDRIGHYPAARGMQEPLLESRRRIFGEEHPDTLRAMSSLAGTLLDQGDLPGARAMQEQALEACRRILGSEHPDTLTAMGNLARTLSNQGDLPEARAMEEQVLEARRRILGEEHPDMLTAISNLARTLSDLGDLPGARAMEEEVLETRRRVLGAEHPHTLTAMGNLANTLWAQGELPGARSLLELALEARRCILGAEHPETLSNQGDLAVTLSDQGDLPGARSLQEVVLEACRRLLGAEHPYTLLAINNLAGTLNDQGDMQGARLLQEQVLEARQRILGDEHPGTLSALINLACTLRGQGDLPGARSLQEDVLEARRRILGAEHPGTLSAMDNLASTLLDQGDLSSARSLQEVVIEARRRILGEEHPDTYTAMGNLARTLSDQGDLPGARELEERVLEARRRILGEEHPGTLSAMGNLAGTLSAQRDLQGARSLQEEVLEARRRILGEEHPGTLSAMYNLANTLEKLDISDDAASLRSEHKAIRRRCFARDNPERLQCLDALVDSVRLWSVAKYTVAPEATLADDFTTASISVGKFGKARYVCYLDLSPNPATLSVYLYSSLTFPKNRFELVKQWLTELNGTTEHGMVQQVGDNHQLRLERVCQLADGELTASFIDEAIETSVGQLDHALAEIKRRLAGKHEASADCLSCQAKISPKAKFCTECGIPQQGQCLQCKTVLPVSAKFCTECGTPTSVQP